MYISNNRYRLGRITQARLPKAADMLTTQFLEQNKTWMIIEPTYQQTYQFMYDKTKEMLEWEEELRASGIISKQAFLNCVYLTNDDEIVGVLTVFDMTQYLTKTSKVKFEKFNFIENPGKELQKSILKQDLVPGKTIYGMFSTIKKELMGTKVIIYFWMDYGHYTSSLGLKVFYTRCSNLKSYQLLVNYLDAKLMAKISVIPKENKKITLSFIRLPFRPIQEYKNTLEKFKQHAKL